MLLHDRLATNPKATAGRYRHDTASTVGFRDPDGPYADILETAPEFWQAQLLTAIADDLSGEWRMWFDELEAKGKVDEHPEFSVLLLWRLRRSY